MVPYSALERADNIDPPLSVDPLLPPPAPRGGGRGLGVGGGGGGCHHVGPKVCQILH